MPPTTIYQRAAWVDGTVWIDTGRRDGSVYRVTADRYSLTTDCPVTFSRSQVTGELPDVGNASADLRLLDEFVHCRSEDMPLLWAVLLMVWFSSAPQPVFAVFGGAASGKSTTMRFLLDLVDPSTTQAGGALPRDPRDFKALARLRRILVFDNVSKVEPAQSDLVARVTTGGELNGRMLFTDDESHITQLMKPVWLNGIMNGFTRGDLASRAVTVELFPVTAADRLEATEMQARWSVARASIFAGLLELLVRVLAVWGTVSPTGEHRLGEFARILAAIDGVMDVNGTGRLLQQSRELSEQVIDSSPLGMAFRELVDEGRNGPQLTLPDVAHAGIFGSHRNEDLLALLRAHVPEERRHLLPQSTKAMGQAIAMMTSDLELCLEIRITRPRSSSQRLTVIRDISKP